MDSPQNIDDGEKKTTNHSNKKNVFKKSNVILLGILLVTLFITGFIALDFDNDNISNYKELLIGTDLFDDDTDNDGLDDFSEVSDYKTDPLSKNTDGDLFTDYEEIYKYKTDPTEKTQSSLSIKTTLAEGDIFVDNAFLGTGEATKDFFPDTYTITFGDVPYYHTPEPKEIELKFGEQLNIVGEYSEYSPAKINIKSISFVTKGISAPLYSFMINNGNGICELQLKNEGEIKAENVVVSTKLEGSGEWNIQTIGEINAGSTESVSVIPSISQTVLLGTSQKSSKELQFKVEYSSNNIKQEATEKSEIITQYNKNALPYSDAAILCSKYSIPSTRYFDCYYISPQNNEVRSFSSSATKGISSNENKAKAIFDALGEYGVRYVSDPNDPLGEGIDYIQFPDETLEIKAGDCDDLAVLYASLLESVGIETELIHIPGHVFVAYEYSSGNWRKIETTMISAPRKFLGIEIHSYYGDACERGYEEWNENKEVAEIIRTHEAWNLGIVL
nr:transglutaminase-like domain-containing protein [uncultured Methanolobus sp.]